MKASPILGPLLWGLSGSPTGSTDPATSQGHVFRWGLRMTQMGIFPALFGLDRRQNWHFWVAVVPEILLGSQKADFFFDF